MLARSRRVPWVLLFTVGLLANAADALNMGMVTVGNPGNAGDTRYAGQRNTPPSFGGVSYTYQIGKLEVTAEQYTAFLNAVATTDTYGLYNEYMDRDFDPVLNAGCNIKRSGSAGHYTYSVAADWANRPVNFVSWGDAARFANWLTNGQPTGVQDLGTTEDGSYFVDGATSHAALMAVTRKPNARYVLPSEDEWYKAAYHKNDGVTGNYWDYPTGSNVAPSNQLVDPDPGNTATYYKHSYLPGQSTYTIGAPYWRTEVGAHDNSASPYRTFDQGGNVAEWNEGILYGWARNVRGGSSGGLQGELLASYRVYNYSTEEFAGIGFRVAEVPEPTSLLLVIAASTFALRRVRQFQVIR